MRSTGVLFIHIGYYCMAYVLKDEQSLADWFLALALPLSDLDLLRLP